MKIVGHRGAGGLAPENTIAALQKGLEHHVDMLEFDLRVTKDGVVILNHDPEVTDPSGQKLSIKQNTYAQLKLHKPDLATFEEALQAVGQKVPLYVEVKPGVSVKSIVKIIKEYLSKGWKVDNFRLASFDINVLEKLQKALPEHRKIVLDKWSGVRATRHARRIGTNHIVMNQRWLWWGFIRSMTRAGYKLGTYTLNDPAKAARWEQHGLRLVVTDYPDRFEKR